MAKWFVIFTAGEWIYLRTDHMTHDLGWTLAWSMLFYVMMFGMILLHHKKPLWAYLISAGFIAFLMLVFQVPIR
ncbi:hypothetical protein NQZ67_18310 [Paenibacillus sp. SCIV0701]|uniref:Uncharacterized protein n=2 Tax=Paenibacillus soyae TaxID=2969249 RepID=A0A9X2MS66_9BACL|nr:hypothetical protein [Paenibacillus soyae]